jgi:2-oxoisovalerate dehydrogenase E1 component
MPHHFSDKRLHIVSQSSPTGTQFLQAVGIALAAKKEESNEVVYVSSGEGSTSEGEFFEAINWAARESLPVLFFIQDNKYAISVPVEKQTAGGSVFEALKGFAGLQCHQCDGTDFFETWQVVQNAVQDIRAGRGPVLIVAHVVRLLPHSSSDDQRKYRSEEDLQSDLKRDPLVCFREMLKEYALMTDEDDARIFQEVKDEIETAADWAESRPLPDPSTIGNHLYGTMYEQLLHTIKEPEKVGEKVVMVDAINHALREELDRDPTVHVFGEDVADKKGGVFTATKGLSTKFGDQRVFHTPLAEASIIGVAIGLAYKGWKAVPEIQFGDYIWPAFMQIRNELAMIRYRSNGSWHAPVVMRVPVGGYIHGGIYHSQNIESFFAHIPGLRLAYPSTAADAKGLLKFAIRGDDPVIFMEHKALYRQGYAASPEPDADYILPFGQAAVRTEGNHLTVITYGALVQQSIEAAFQLRQRGINVEVIDLRTLNPLDEETIYRSVRKTSKVAVIHEDTLTGGFGAELTARIQQMCFESLDAPVKRIAARDLPIPYSPPLENAVLPNKQMILEALEELALY